ncbi:hypothetical protein SHI21_17130 [Bacteriovorax sp. PP10]|uniref:Uncharacterized protein n=1 Tax=Bacteriovorax antarcticus TaxID=3088717 RepID=A0ABU5VY10_9BACT|nr:hypothetical protein [Bacteriovorax sp. PP10]MEA9357958.1 hypothetical protein [Bacteriovorax sp. PP10]
MKSKKIIAIFFLGFVTNLFANDCAKLLLESNSKNLNKVISCGFSCNKDEECEEANVCNDAYAVNKNYTPVLKKYLEQFYEMGCVSRGQWYSAERVCFEAKCIANKCIRKSTSCSVKVANEPVPNFGGQVINLPIDNKPKNYIYPHFKKDQKCVIELSDLDKMIPIVKVEPTDSSYKTLIALAYAEEQIAKKNNDDKVYCATVHLIKTPVTLTNGNLTFKELYPDVYNKTLSYLIKFFSYSPVINKEIFSNAVDGEWYGFLMRFNGEIKFLNVLPEHILKPIYTSKSSIKWNEEEALFYINNIFLKGIQVRPPLNLGTWLEKSPDFYKKNVIPIISSTDIKVNDSFDSYSFAPSFLTKNLISQNQEELIKVLNSEGDTKIKCYTGIQVIKYYSVSTKQKSYLSLENSKSPCIKKIAENISSLTRVENNGCSSFSFGTFNLSTEHFAQLKFITDSCYLQCNVKEDCNYIQKDCFSNVPVNKNSMQSQLKLLEGTISKCDKKFPSSIQMDCVSNYCREVVTKCEYNDFKNEISSFVKLNSMDTCNSNEDCIVFSYTTNNIKPIYLSFNKNIPEGQNQIWKFANKIGFKCDDQGTPPWQTSARSVLYVPPPKSACTQNKCMLINL